MDVDRFSCCSVGNVGMNPGSRLKDRMVVFRVIPFPRSPGSALSPFFFFGRVLLLE